MIHGNPFLNRFNVILHFNNLSWWANDELYALCNVTGEALIASLEQLLLVVIGSRDNVEDLLDTFWVKLGWDGEEVAASELLNLGTTLDAWEVDESWLDNTRLSLGSSNNLLGESGTVSVAQR